MSYNTNDETTKLVHQPGGTGVQVRGTLTQYVKSTSKDSRGLGRYCSVAMKANPNKIVGLFWLTPCAKESQRA